MYSSNGCLQVNCHDSVLSFLKHQVQHLTQRFLSNIDVENPQVARRICTLIPAQCPLERDITLFGYHLFHIPALCHLNPAFEQLMEIRFRALCYLADRCGEDVTIYFH